VEMTKPRFFISIPSNGCCRRDDSFVPLGGNIAAEAAQGPQEWLRNSSGFAHRARAAIGGGRVV
jgi:hypothetical protein